MTANFPVVCVPAPATATKLLYRFIDVGDVVMLKVFVVAKHTPKGVRLDCGKYLPNASHKPWALPTKEEALRHYFIRKRKHLDKLSEEMASVIRNMNTMLTADIEAKVSWSYYSLEGL